MLKFNVPNHEKDLNEAENLLKRVHSKVVSPAKLGKDRRKAMLMLTTDVLYVIGDLSQFIFDLSIEMEKAYDNHYKKSPALGKKLYLKHYETLHKPYDKLKNRAHKLIQIIDPLDEGIEEEIYF